MAGHEYKLAFMVAGKLSADFQKTFKNAQQLMKDTGGKLGELNRQASNVQGMLKHKNAVAQAGKAHAQAKVKMQELVAQAQRTGTAVNRDSKEFLQAEKAIKKTGLALDQARAKMQAYAKASGLGGMSMKQLQGQSGQLQGQIANQQRMMSAKDKWERGQMALMAGGYAVTSGISEMVRYGAEFEHTMVRVKAISEASSDEYEKLSARARELGKATEWSATEVGQGMQFLAMTGMKSNQIIKVMPDLLNLASAGAIDLASASDIATNILSGFGYTGEKAGEQIGHMADILAKASSSANVNVQMLGESMKYSAPVAKDFGLSMEMATAMTAKLGDAGIQGSEAGTALRAILLRVATTGKKAVQSLGVATTEIRNGKVEMRGIDSIMSDIAKKFETMGGAERLEWVNKIAGKQSASAFSALVDNTEKIKENFASLSDTLKNSEGTAKKMAEEQLQSAMGQYKILQSAWGEFKISAFKALAPVLSTIGSGLQKIVDFMNDLNESAPWLTTIIMTLAGAFGVLAVVCPILTGLFLGMSGAIGGLKVAMLFLSANPIVLVIAGIVALIAIIYAFRKEIMAVISYIGGAFLSAWTTAWESVKNVFSSVYEWIVDKLEGIIRIAKNIGNAIGSISFSGGGGSGGGGSVPHMADGGIVSKPTLALIGEGRESEAVIPLSKLAQMQGGGVGGISVSFSPVIQMGDGGDAYAQVRRGLDAGAKDLKQQLEHLLNNQRRVSYA